MAKFILTHHECARLQQMGRDNWLVGFSDEELLLRMESDWAKEEQRQVIIGWMHCQLRLRLEEDIIANIKLNAKKGERK